jgi:hypothetical protein
MIVRLVIFDDRSRAVLNFVLLARRSVRNCCLKNRVGRDLTLLNQRLPN